MFTKLNHRISGLIPLDFKIIQIKLWFFSSLAEFDFP